MKKTYSILVKGKYLIILFITGIVHLFFVYGHAFKQPNDVLSVSDGDGMKNYYAYITEVKSGENNQLSFNYPYGESYLFTDSNPFLARTLHYLNNLFPNTEHYSIGILNILMILNILATYLVLFLLIRCFVKKEWYALLWAFAIMLLQPQIDRLGGHLSLSYSLAIPLCFYWVVLYYQTNRKILYGCLLLGSNFLWLGTHAYLGVMTCAFTFLFDAHQYFVHKEFRNRKEIGLILLKSIVPLVIFLIYLSVTDIHTGRTTNPWGFFAYGSNLASIFLPYCGWGARLLQRTIPIHQTWEGIAYIGLFSTICVVALVVFFIKSLIARYIKKRTCKKLPFEMGLFAPALFAALICLLFSMGFPFKLGLRFLLDQLSFIKNFRATGRFAWTFFFVITTFSSYAIYQYTQVKWKHKKKIFIYLILIGAPIFTMLEGVSYQKTAYKELFRTKNIFLFQNLDTACQEALKTINSEEYQAIIPLPFYQGSENFSKDAPTHIHNVSNLFAYHFALPLMASHMARTSIWESRNLTQMFAPEYYKKLITSDIPSDKKFLIICMPDNNALTEYEQDFLKKATFLFKANEVEFWEIEASKITEVITLPYIDDFKEKRDALIFQENYFLSKPDTTVFLLSFDTEAAKYKFLGNGAYEQPLKERYSIFTKIEQGKLEENREYELSFWYYIGGENYGQDKLNWTIFISQKDEVSGENIALLQERSRSQGNPIVLGDWAFTAYRFTIKNKNLPTQFVITKTPCKGYQTTIDEILIRPVDVDVYRILEEDNMGIKKLYKNGHIIERDL